MMTKPTSEQVTFLAAGSGATQRTALDKLRDVVSVNDFGAIGNGVADDTAAINAAIAALPANGGRVLFPSIGPYKCNLLIKRNNITLEGVTGAGGTNDTMGRVVGLIPADITQPVLQVGDDTGYVAGFQAINLNLWRGVGGQYGLRLHGGVLSARFVNFRVHGFERNAIWIENGPSYPITFVYFTNCSASAGSVGSTEAVIFINSVAPQYTTAVYFSNGYSNVGLGGYSIHIKNTFASFANFWVSARDNQGLFFDYDGTGTVPRVLASNLTVDSDSSADVLLESNYSLSGAKLPTSFVSGTATFDGIAKFFDATTADIKDTGTWARYPLLLFPVNVGTTYYTTTSDTTPRDVSIDRSGSGASSVMTLTSPGEVHVSVGGATRVVTATTTLRPGSDNAITCGSASQRWSDVYSASPTINTSDASEKQQIMPLTAAEIAVAMELKSLVRSYKFNDSVNAKGSAARIHVGMIAQDIKDAFARHGLDAHSYGMFCYDEWEAIEEIVEDGVVIQASSPAGSRYGIRYDELLAFIIAAI
jgi:hypothetical protein